MKIKGLYPLYGILVQPSIERSALCHQRSAINVATFLCVCRCVIYGLAHGPVGCWRNVRHRHLWQAKPLQHVACALLHACCGAHQGVARKNAQQLFEHRGVEFAVNAAFGLFVPHEEWIKVAPKKQV